MEQGHMNMIEEWFELSAARRHFYFYICLLLFALAMHSFQSGPAGQIDLDTQLLAEAIELRDAPPPLIESCPLPGKTQ
jgi:hypothetical protein